MTVYVIGSINQDIVATSDSHMRPGETLTGNDLNYYPGGKGANQAIAAARAGAAVAMIGCTGDDAAGSDLRAYLAEAGVDVTRVQVKAGTPTGTALIVVAQGENSIIVIQGANQEVGLATIEGIPFAAGDVVVSQFETPVATALAAFTKARQLGARTLLNPSPVEPIAQELLYQLDFLVVNEHEFEQIFDRPLGPVLHGKAGAPAAFAGTLIVTLGSDGVLTLSGGGRIRHGGRSVEVVDSTGAGDCFAGYLAAALHDGNDLENAVALANVAASMSVTRPGAASSMPEISDVRAASE
jgi:ribokinase